MYGLHLKNQEEQKFGSLCHIGGICEIQSVPTKKKICLDIDQSNHVKPQFAAFLFLCLKI